MHDASIFWPRLHRWSDLVAGFGFMCPRLGAPPSRKPVPELGGHYFEDVFVHRSQTGRNHGDARQVEDGGEMQRRAGNKALK